MAYSLETLPEDRQEEALAIAELWEARKGLDGSAGDAALQEVYDRAARIELPVYMVVSRSMRLMHECLRDEHRAAIGTYLEIMRLVETYADVIDPLMVETAHLTAAGAFLGLMSLPEVPREQIESFLDQAEREQRRVGAPLWGLLLSRALWAAQSGDAEAMRHWVDEWHLNGPAEGEGHSNTVTLDAHFLAVFDLDAAIAHLDRHLPTARYDADDDEEVRIEVGTRLAGYRALVGDEATAADEATRLIERYGLDAVVEHAETDCLVRALETVGPLGDEVAARVEAEYDPDDASEYLTAAALARRYLRRDPDSARGRELGELAERGAAAYDRRNGTRFLTGQLKARWFTSL